MKLKCIAIDDEPPALELIKEYASKIPDLQLIETFDDAISGAEFLNNANIDLLFIDINMPDITGIELVRSLKEKPLTIFTTAYKKFAFDGFELEAIDYLLKPIDFDRFKKAATRAIDFFNYRNNNSNTDDESLFVRSEYRMIKIPLRDIDYIESLDDYIKIHITGAKPILTLMPMKKVLDKLPQDKFKRIHRGYIVPINNVISVINRKVKLSSSVELPVSESYLSFIDEWMKK